MLEWVEEDLNHEQDDEEEDEGGVEVGDVEGGTEPTDESVSANHHGEEHCCQFGAQISHKAVQDCSSGHGEGHHHDEVGEEGEGAEDQVGPGSEAGFDHLVEVQ